MTPTRADFQTMDPADVRDHTDGKAILLSPGASRQWFEAAHEGGPADYARQVVARTLEIARMIAKDGFHTLFIAGYRWDFTYSVEGKQRTVYHEFPDADYGDLGVRFRGNWLRVLEAAGADDLLPRFEAVEQEHAGEQAPWVIWLAPDRDPIPQQLTALVEESIRTDGRMPTREALIRAYYDHRPLDHVDMVVKHGPPSLNGLQPPLLALGDLYTMHNPTLALERDQWRAMLHDHLFQRGQAGAATEPQTSGIGHLDEGGLWWPG